MNDIMEKKKKVILELMNDKTYIPMKFKELAVVLNIAKENRDQLEEVLSELLKDFNNQEGQVCYYKGTLYRRLLYK